MSEPIKNSPKNLSLKPPSLQSLRPPVPQSLLAARENPTFSAATMASVNTEMATHIVKRRFPRFAVEIYAKVFIDGFEYLRKTVDISEGGVLLDDLLPDGMTASKQVRIILFDLDHTDIELLARSVEGPNKHRAFEFFMPEEKIVDLIQHWTKKAA